MMLKLNFNKIITVTLLSLICMVSLSISRAYAQETMTIDAPTDDSSVFEARPDLNRGGADYLYVGVGVYTSGYPARTWVKFGLSSIPDGVVITKAELRLHFESIVSYGNGAPGGMGVHFSSDDTWEETVITWNNQPSFESTPTFTVSEGKYDGWVSFDVTSDVISEYSGDGVVSWCLCAVNEEGGGKNFNTADSDECSQTYGPYLYIEYQPAPEQVIPVVPFGTATIIALAVLAFGTMALLSKRNSLRHITSH